MPSPIKKHLEIFAASSTEYQDINNRILNYQKDLPIDMPVDHIMSIIDKEIILAYFEN